MSTPAQAAGDATGHAPEMPFAGAGPPAPQGVVSHLRRYLPTVPEAFASLLRTVVVALFLLTFVLQPFLIPSESMEHTLLVGDFLLVNKQVLAPAGEPGSFEERLEQRILPYRDVQRGDIVVFHHLDPHYPLLIKRVIGTPGDRIRMESGRVEVNGAPLDEPYATYEPAIGAPSPDVPARFYTNPYVTSDWWQQMQRLTQNGELVVPPGMYFMLGDNRNNSEDSRFWGLVPRQAIIARPLVIYFSLRRPSATDIEEASDDRLGHDRELSARLAGFARWKRIFLVVH
ncbi:MAG TPA: signal peptidase I [Terracidiphilus sp.]|jgi:signal peptidase I